MEILRVPDELRSRLDEMRCNGNSIGFVPTMGALHAGHLDLVKTAGETDVTVVSIFVNPLQFGPTEDFRRYPRPAEQDEAMLRDAGVRFLYRPEVSAMYQPGFDTQVEVGAVARPLEGERRPGHFRGVATVVLKLLNAVGPCSAYFGEKDYQQLQVVKAMARDLDLPVRIMGCPTVREPDGLALSSRNRYLSAEERAVAPALLASLTAVRDAIRSGERDPDRAEAVGRQRLLQESRFDLDYLVVRDPQTLQPVRQIEGPVRILAAARLGAARLIDNIPAP